LVEAVIAWYKKARQFRISKQLVRQILGWIFLCAGIAGLVLPVLQGLLFLLIALFLLSKDIPFFQNLLNRLRERYPGITRKADKISQKLDDN